jgi:hypothetical protein
MGNPKRKVDTVVSTKIPAAKPMPMGDENLKVDKEAVLAAAAEKLSGTFKVVDGTIPVPQDSNKGAPSTGACDSDQVKLNLTMGGKK